MRRTRLAFVLAACLVPVACRSAGGGGASGVDTARRVPVQLVLDQPTVPAAADSFTFTVRLTNDAREPVRVDLGGDPPFPRNLKDKVPLPALWYTIERNDVASSTGSFHLPFAPRDTVLAPAGELTVPVTHSLRLAGLSPGAYRIRAGIGLHASRWETFTVGRR